MGRSGGSGGRSGGGSFGGGRSSGGSFGGSRSSGGRSGGSFSSGRSGGSFGSKSSGSSFRSSKSSGSSFGSRPSGGFFYGGGYRPRPSITGRRRNYGSGCAWASGCFTFFIILVIILIIVSIFSYFKMTTGIRDITGSVSGITKSSIVRQPLKSGSVNETDYYTDELGWIGNETQLVKGLKYFYNKTGVQPHVFITDTVDGSHSPTSDELDKFANNLYDELFTDEAHLLFVFFEYNDNYMDRYVCGTQAKTVIDREAADILLDYIDRYYYDNSLTDEEFFSKAFEDAADRIMTVTKSPWINVFKILGIVLLVIILFSWWRYNKKQKNIEAKRTAEMLKTPLEKFGDTEVENLAKKYQDDNKNSD